MAAFLPASGVQLPWSKVPQRVLAARERRPASPIAAAVTQPGGEAIAGRPGVPYHRRMLDALLSAWDLAAPPTVRPVSSGLNNRTDLVTTPHGVYLLRRYRNTADRARVRYEHALLHRLQAARLSFRVPTPVATRDGETVGTVAGTGELAALFAHIPGRRPERGNRRHLHAVGEALAELHRALARVALPLPAPHAAYGDLATIHPLAPEPRAVPDALPLEDAERVALRRILADVLRAVPALYAALPRQLIHGDYGPGNTLIVGDRISGVLDFEFAGSDLRAFDVAAGYYQAAGEAWEAGDPWPLLTAFLDGYLAAAPFTIAEAKALPALSRLQQAATLVYWLGRRRAGTAAEADVIERARRLLRHDAWLDEHGAALVAYVGAPHGRSSPGRGCPPKRPGKRGPASANTLG